MAFTLESIAQLDHSKEFASLHQKFHQFNPFKVLRVDQMEIRHSNVLAWLLNPNENHQLGSFFIKKLVSRLMTRVENEDKVQELDFLPYLYAMYSDIEVYREVKTKTNRFIDLVVVSPSLTSVFLIENKFHAAESLGQLEDYLTFIENKYKEYRVIPIFLTLRKEVPSHLAYWILDYHDVLEILVDHLELNKEAIANNVFDFLSYYSEILKEELVEDDEATQLALTVYQKNKVAIDILYISQHPELRQQQRYQDLIQQLSKLTTSQSESIRRIYEKNKRTIDFVFKMGSNVLREAFLSFVTTEEIPDHLYRAHVSVPNFILPEWADFVEIVGEPEDEYWLGNAFILWFERTWDERLKINIEIGPLPYEKRLKLLESLEKNGISIRPTAKLEGKKYTKIYTDTIEIEDWANKQQIIDGLNQLYHHPHLKTVFKNIALAVQSMENEQPLELSYQQTPERKQAFLPITPFIKFAEKIGLEKEEYRIQTRIGSFIIPPFRELEESYGPTREKWWWHNSTFVFWFERLRDDRLKLTLELGPLQQERRLLLIEKLESLGVSFSNQSKLSTAKYTRIFSKSIVIENWENEELVLKEMLNLYTHPSNQELIEIIRKVRDIK